MADVKPSIEEVLGHYGAELPVYHRAHGHKIKCPFHGDTRASAVYNEDKQTFKCFACDRSGDAWQLIMDEEGCDFPTAIGLALQHGWVERDPLSGELVGPGGQRGPGLSAEHSGSGRRAREGGRTRLRRKPRARP